MNQLNFPSHASRYKKGIVVACTSLGLLLSSCGGDEITTAATTSMSGTVATGSPVSGANVNIKCKDNSTATTTTNSNGYYSVQIQNSAFPCALRTSGGTANGVAAPTLHSFASAPGTANITPLTDLALALQTNTTAGQTIATWFSTPSNWDTISAALSTALNTLRTALQTAGYIIPATWSAGSTAPFTAAFTPNPTSDPYDQLLEAIAAGIQNAATTYSDLLTSFIGGGALPTAPAGTGPETQPANVHASLAGSYSLTFDGNCESACSYDDGQSYSATVSGNTLTIGGKTLSNPVNQKVGGTFNLVEVIWADNNLRYALSRNDTGVFNEINVSDASQPQASGLPKFLGQFTGTLTPPATGGDTAIGLATVSAFSSSSTLAETLTAVVGTHDVAIYKAPTIGEIGAGKLIVSNSGGNISFTLESASGNVVAAVTVPETDNSCGDGVCVNLFDQWTTPIGGRRISIRDYYADPIKKAILVGFLPDGYIYGEIDGGYKFRNNVLNFGTTVPNVFSTLAGSYSGPHEANTCLPNPISVTIANDGSVNLQGKTSLSCTAQDHTATWDGMDDYIIPTATGAQLVIDSTRIGGSQTGGGITIDIANNSNASTFSYLYSNFAGANGHIALPSPTKQ